MVVKIKTIQKRDAAFILVLLIAAAIMLLWPRSRDNLTAVITIDGEKREEISLDAVSSPYIITPGTDPAVTIQVEKGKIYFLTADCSDKICVNTGILSKEGDTAVCLPAKAVISIERNDVDAVTY